MKCAVLGFPVNHSLSPIIFRYLSLKFHRKLDYSKIEMLPENLNSFLQESRNTFLGFNVTIPLKEKVLESLDMASSEVELIGACNVLKIEDGKIYGFNSDIYGIIYTIKQYPAVLGQVSLTPCLILGTGGASKACIYALAKLGAKKIFVFSRNSQQEDDPFSWTKKIEDAFVHLSVEIVTSSSKILSDSKIGIIINATPLGMKGQAKGDDYFQLIKQLHFSPQALAFDLIYNPSATTFLNIVSSLTQNQVGGMLMLAAQAIKTWEWWFGGAIESAVFNKIVNILEGTLKLKESHHTIFLCGFMGAGKSTVGEILANNLGFEFVDLDQKIVLYSNKTIKELFLEGEDNFRKIESRLLKEIQFMGQQVISLGGGVLEFFDHLKWIKNKGLLIYLQTSEAELEQRLFVEGKAIDDHRPLLKSGAWKEMHQTRIKKYQQAHISQLTDGFSPSEIVFEILDKAKCL